MQKAFVDVRIFYQFSQSYRSQALSAIFRSMERAKKKKYNSKIMETSTVVHANYFLNKWCGWYGSRGKSVLRSSVGIDRRHDNSFPETGLGEAQDQIWSSKQTVICLRGSRSRKNIVPLGDMRNIVQISQDSKNGL